MAEAEMKRFFDIAALRQWGDNSEDVRRYAATENLIRECQLLGYSPTEKTFASNSLTINEETIPDDDFREWLSISCDLDGDGILNQDELQSAVDQDRAFWMTDLFEGKNRYGHDIDDPSGYFSNDVYAHAYDLKYSNSDEIPPEGVVIAGLFEGTPPGCLSDEDISENPFIGLIKPVSNVATKDHQSDSAFEDATVITYGYDPSDYDLSGIDVSQYWNDLDVSSLSDDELMMTFIGVNLDVTMADMEFHDDVAQREGLAKLDLLRGELAARGISDEELITRQDELLQACAEKDWSALEGKTYSTRMLAAFNYTTQEYFTAYALLSPEDRCLVPGLKPLIETETRGTGVDGGERWDAYSAQSDDPDKICISLNGSLGESGVTMSLNSDQLRAWSDSTEGVRTAAFDARMRHELELLHYDYDNGGFYDPDAPVEDREYSDYGPYVDIELNEEDFDDPEFYTYLVSMDDDGDGVLNEDEQINASNGIMDWYANRLPYGYDRYGNYAPGFDGPSAGTDYVNSVLTDEDLHRVYIQEPHMGAEYPIYHYRSGNREFDAASDKAVILNQGTRTECFIYDRGNGIMHCDSPWLGSFDYDSSEFAVGYKDIPDTDGSKLPVLKFVGELSWDAYKSDKSALGNIIDGQNVGKSLGAGVGQWWYAFASIFDPSYASDKFYGEQVHVPDGCRVVDYMFEGVENLQLVPGLPRSCVSAHAYCKDCPDLWGTSQEFASSTRWYLPSGLEDLGYAFSGSSKFKDNDIGQLNENIRDITDMLASTRAMADSEVWHDWTVDLGAIGDESHEVSVEGCYYLLPAYADMVDENSSEEAKKNNRSVLEQVNATQAALRSAYDAGELPPDVAEKWKQVNAVGAVYLAEETDAGAIRVRPIGEIENNLKENPFGESFQKFVIGLGSCLGLKTVTGLFTDSKIIKWGVGIGGTLLLSSTGILPKSIEPLLNNIKDMMPDGVFKTGFGKFIDMIHVPSEEERQAAYEEQMDKYRPIALGQADSLYSLCYSGGMDIRASMRNNAEVLATYNVFYDCGNDYIESGDKSAAHAAGEATGAACAAAEHAIKEFDGEVSAGTMTESDFSDNAWRYYKGMFEGYDAYNEGAVKGINASQSEPGDIEKSRLGVQMVNQEAFPVMMESLLKMDAEYHFMTPERWAELDAMDFPGCPKPSEYTPGSVVMTSVVDRSYFEPNTYDQSSAGRTKRESEAVVTEAEHVVDSDEHAETETKAESSTEAGAEPVEAVKKSRGEIAEETTGFTGDEFDDPEAEAEAEAD